MDHVRVYRWVIIDVFRIPIPHLEKGGVITTMASGEEVKVRRREATALRELVV